MRSFRVGSLIEGVFGPIYRGALVYALAQLKDGWRPTYFEAMSVGLRNWGRLFSVRFSPAYRSCLGSSYWWFPESCSWFATRLSMPSSCLKE